MGKQINYYPGYGDTNNNYPRDTYVITKERLDEIRREKLYPFFDRDEDGGRGDFVPELNDNSVQVQKQLNFLLPFFGFGFNYTWVSNNFRSKCLVLPIDLICEFSCRFTASWASVTRWSRCQSHR
jgi:hypothetical protein